MTFEEFIKQEQERLSEFKEFWIKNNKLYPEKFPMKMAPGDWVEQFLMF